MAQPSIFDPLDPHGLLVRLRQALAMADTHYPLQITFEMAQREELSRILDAAEPHLPRRKGDVSHHKAICTRGCCCLECNLHCDCKSGRGAPHTPECRLTHECRKAH